MTYSGSSHALSNIGFLPTFESYLLAFDAEKISIHSQRVLSNVNICVMNTISFWRHIYMLCIVIQRSDATLCNSKHSNTWKNNDHHRQSSMFGCLLRMLKYAWLESNIKNHYIVYNVGPSDGKLMVL